MSRHFLIHLACGAFCALWVLPVHGQTLTVLDDYVQKTYAVGDLVIPVDYNVYLLAEHAAKASAKPKPAGGETEQPIRKSQTAMPPETLEVPLRRLICEQIAPESWEAKGGKGQIQYFALGMAFVVTQTPKVHQQIQKMLSDLRRLQDIEISLEMRVAWVSEAVWEKWAEERSLEKPEQQDGKTTSPQGELAWDRLSDKEVRHFLELAQGDRRSDIMQAPKVTLFPGQKIATSITQDEFYTTRVDLREEGGQLFVLPTNEKVPIGWRFTTLATVSEDARFVRLHLQMNYTEKDGPVVHVPVKVPVPQGEGKSWMYQSVIQQPSFHTIALDRAFKIPDGCTVLIHCGRVLKETRNEYGSPILSKVPYLSRLVRNVGYGREAMSLILLVTPRIIRNVEEDTLSVGGIHSPSAKTRGETK